LRSHIAQSDKTEPKKERAPRASIEGRKKGVLRERRNKRRLRKGAGYGKGAFRFRGKGGGGRRKGEGNL